MVAVFIDMTAQAGGLIVTMTPADPDTSVSASNMTSSTTVADALPPPHVGYVFTLFYRYFQFQSLKWIEDLDGTTQCGCT